MTLDLVLRTGKRKSPRRWLSGAGLFFGDYFDCRCRSNASSRAAVVWVGGKRHEVVASAKRRYGGAVERFEFVIVGAEPQAQGRRSLSWGNACRKKVRSGGS